MRWSYSIVAVIILGLFSLFILFLFEEATVANEQDYFNLKETTEAAMYDAVDVAYYRDTGNMKIIEEKFIESFLRRFSENQKLDNYNVQFYDIMEDPAKVTVKVSNNTGSYNIYGTSSSVKVVNKLSAILDTPDDELSTKESCTRMRIIYSAPWAENTSGDYSGQFELNQWDGYDAVNITYKGSWRSELKATDVDIASNYLINYRQKRTEVFKSYYESAHDAYPIQIFVSAFANISDMSANFIGNNKVETKFHYECETRMRSTVNGSEKDVCMLGTIYQVEYKKNNCN